jgi:hypothetical protein
MWFGWAKLDGKTGKNQDSGPVIARIHETTVGVGENEGVR